MKFSLDQEVAAKHIERWSTQSSEDLTFGGLAGTGKTTLLQQLWPSLESRGAIAVALSGKAVQVLNAKSIPAITIHRLIYQFQGFQEDSNGNLQPVFRDKEGFGDFCPKRIVCDESSMVSTRIYEDIKKRGLPVLWVGDHGQLGPIGGDPGLMKNPKIRLERIHRQAADNPIIRLAMKVRETGRIDHSLGKDNILITANMTYDDISKFVVEEEVDQVILSRNATRHKLNHQIRLQRGRTEILEENDRLICTCNDWEYQVFNGQTFRVRGTPELDETGAFWRANLDEETLHGWLEREETFPLQDAPLGNPTYRSNEKDDRLLEFDYGEAITTHKSQGSQWKHTFVIDEALPIDDRKRRLYTGITRAQESLAVYTRTL